MRSKSVLQIITSLVVLVAAAESDHLLAPLQRRTATSTSAETANTTDQCDMPFNLHSMTNIGDESYLPRTKRRSKRRLGGKEPELERRDGHEVQWPITVKLDKIPRSNLWTGQVRFDVGKPIPIRIPRVTVFFDTSLGDFRLVSSVSKGNSQGLKLYKPLTDQQQQAEHHFAGDYVTPKSIDSATFKDTVYVSGVPVTDVYIVSLAQVDATRRIGADGVIGMSFDTNRAVSQLHFFNRFLSLHQHAYHVFAFYFGDHAELHLGGIKKSAYLGWIEYHKIVPIKHELLLWTIEKGAILIGDLDCGLIMERAFINTGSQAVHGPYNQVKSFYEKIGGFEWEFQGRGKRFMYPCERVRPIIAFKWRDMEWLYEDFGMQTGKVCLGGIQAHEYPFDPDIWSIGTSWMKDKYVVFNRVGEMVGFAKADLSYGQPPAH